MELLFTFPDIPVFSSPFNALLFVFLSGGWILIVLALVKGLWKLWVFERQNEYGGTLQSILLSINVPKETEQTPKAVENVFAHLSGMLSGKGTLYERYWQGKFQESFSCELVSRGGRIQYFVRVPLKIRDTVEAALFAQYPDAEIIEATDYALEVPQKYPDETYDLWGTELTLSKSDVYPLKTYISFEHSLSATFKDPLASLLEFLGTLRSGEQVWIQFPLAPVDDDWHERSVEEVKKLIGAKPEAKKKNIAGQTGDALIGGINETTSALLRAALNTPAPLPGKPASASSDQPTLMQHLSPGERVVLEQVQMKGAKHGFRAKVRVIYVAPKTIFDKSRVVTGVLGSFRQFGSIDLNSFKSDKYTKVAANYFRVAQRITVRQNKIIAAYVRRSLGRGGKPYVLNIEELATLWHFPSIDTKAPLIARLESKRGEPPSRLPLQEDEDIFEKKNVAARAATQDKTADELPDNIPFL